MRTAEGLLLPDFLIVGAMKGGTTSLSSYLRQHPDIFIPKLGQFFDRDRQWQKGLSAYAALFGAASAKQRIGDVTPAYSYGPFHHPPIPERIASVLPDAKIVWCLRDPVARAYSHYWHNRTHGLEAASFEQALAREDVAEVPPGRAFRERGVYVKQIRAYLECFPRHQTHIVLSESLFADPGRAVHEVFRFLNVNDTVEIPTLGRVYNRNWKLISPPILARLVLLVLRRRPRLRRRIQNRFGSARPALKPETQRALAEFYRPYNAELAELTGLDLTPWQSP
jgi:hypothetical protein